MSEAIISVSNLGKKYRILHQAERQRYTALRDVIAEKAKRLFSKGQKTAVGSQTAEDFWALKDVSFEVKQGEVVGIIGRNGAGKSTLLKILSRITEPTTGRVHLKGRVASLLEVGTGFHPELTGRENVFLNGAILGMSRAEIRKKFDEIVAFAEVEKFLDTPVKRYSSGMYVRLAFAVAAHLEPEILIVDEVLAVGDTEFQKKCLGKMQDVATKEGRTVLFVSHNMVAIETLTDRCIQLDGGHVLRIGQTSEVIKSYLDNITALTPKDFCAWTERRGVGQQRLLHVETRDIKRAPKRSFRPGETIILHFELESPKSNLWDLAFAIEHHGMTPLFASHLSDSQPIQARSGILIYEVPIVPNLLRHGQYLISTGIYSPDFKICHDEVLHFPIFEIAGISEGIPNDGRWGMFFLQLNWESINNNVK